MASVNVINRTARSLLLCRSYSLNLCKKINLWTPDNIVKSPHPDVVIPNRTVPEHIWENMEKWADKTAVICGITNHSYTYHQLYKYSRNFATQLRTQLNICEGDVVCVMMPNSPDFPLAILGALQAGAEVTTVNPIYTAHEVKRQLILSNPKIVISTVGTIDVIKEALILSQKELPTIVVKSIGDSLPSGTISFEELSLNDNVDHSVLNKVKRKVDDIAFIPYSSGTTGLPKGVELMNSNIIVNSMQQDVVGVKYYEDTTISHQESVLGMLPFFHIYGLSVLMLHKLSIGAKIVTLPKFQPNTFLKAMKEHKISILYSAPPMVLFLGSHPEVAKEHLASIKTITSGAAPVPKKDVERVLDKAKQKIDFLQLYGLTETSPLVTAMLPGSDDYTTAGFAVSNTELGIANSDMLRIGPNEVGELLIRGPQVMKGYRNNPEATKDSIIVDGWFKSGDLAKINENGVITIIDRLKELIKVKGYQVPPAELENVLKEHPSILDAAVVGIPDARTGEAPKAFIVLKDGHTVETKDITNFVTERVAEYKRVKEVMFLDVLPKNPSGKILRKVLKEQFC